ncbi:MAG: hypothetical protein QOD90_4880 [Mycobacterium sp.]|jgi:hypothetical protein|nr:hypothetical protein [Mycobacterium sp.]
MSREARAVLGVLTVMAGLVAIASILTPAISRADTCVDSDGLPLPIEASPCADVLTQEARWLVAITSGDVAGVEAILAPTFRHVNSDGQLLDRGQEIASTEPLPFTFVASDQIVDIAGDTAVIHGVNNVTRDGRVVDRERFTDVFVRQDGLWMALSAQETKL